MRFLSHIATAVWLSARLSNSGGGGGVTAAAAASASATLSLPVCESW